MAAEVVAAVSAIVFLEASDVAVIAMAAGVEFEFLFFEERRSQSMPSIPPPRMAMNSLSPESVAAMTPMAMIASVFVLIAFLPSFQSVTKIIASTAGLIPSIKILTFGCSP